MASSDSRRVVLAALAGNALIAVSKFVAAAFTGSTAMLAEGVHSVADTGNQALLFLGMRLARRRKTVRHPFGRSVERYFWAFVVSMMLFTIGGVFAVYEGVHKLMALMDAATGQSAASHDPSSRLWNYGVLGVSLLFEGGSFLVAFRELRRMRRGGSLWRSLFESRDPTVPVVFMEDAAALTGLLLALVGVGLSDLTGWAGWDGFASVVIGLLLCVVAVLLARDVHSLLLGESATPEDQEAVQRIVEGVEGVRQLTQLLSMHRGPDDVLLALKVAFDPSLPLARIEQLVDEMEAAIRAEMPHMRHIFVEPDSDYDPGQDPDAPSKRPSYPPA